VLTENHLPEDRVQQMEEIGFVWDPLANAWDQKFSELLAFKENHGHCNIPRSYVDNPALAKWVNWQRLEKRRNRLSEDRLLRLREIGFIWEPRDDTWEQMFAALRTFTEKHEHCNVRQSYDDNPDLGTWVTSQRILKKKNRLPEDHMLRLDKIGFTWNPHANAWEQNIAVLLAFKEKPGHCNVPRSYADNPALAKWVSWQRMEKRKDRLPEDRVQRLEEIGFAWVLREVSKKK